MATQVASQNPTPDVEKLAKAVDEALARVRTLDEAARNHALALKEAIEEFHKAGLKRIVQLIRQSPQGRELLRQMASEPIVFAMFALHGLVRTDLRMRVSQVLEQVRPYLQSHGGDVSLVDIRDGRVLVRLQGACQSCSLSTATLRNAVEEVLKRHVPEVKSVEAVPTEPEGFVPLESLQLKEHGWVLGPKLEELPEAMPTSMQLDQHSVLFLRRGEQVLAFRNQCPHQHLPLEGASYDPQTQLLRCPWHQYTFEVSTGRCVHDPECCLEAFPVRVEEGRIWVRPC